jgi:hypothetical protein
MDLTSAVGNALSRQNEEQESQMLPPPVPAVDESDQDELAGDVEPSPSKPQRTGMCSKNVIMTGCLHFLRVLVSSLTGAVGRP